MAGLPLACWEFPALRWHPPLSLSPGSSLAVSGALTHSHTTHTRDRWQVWWVRSVSSLPASSSWGLYWWMLALHLARWLSNSNKSSGQVTGRPGPRPRPTAVIWFKCTVFVLPSLWNKRVTWRRFKDYSCVIFCFATEIMKSALLQLDAGVSSIIHPFSVHPSSCTQGCGGVLEAIPAGTGWRQDGTLNKLPVHWGPLIHQHLTDSLELPVRLTCRRSWRTWREQVKCKRRTEKPQNWDQTHNLLPVWEDSNTTAPDNAG